MILSQEHFTKTNTPLNSGWTCIDALQSATGNKTEFLDFKTSGLLLEGKECFLVKENLIFLVAAKDPEKAIEKATLCFAAKIYHAISLPMVLTLKFQLSINMEF